MKVLVATAALVTLLASSALAQTPRYGYDAYSAYGAYRGGPGAAFASPRPYASYPDYGSYGPRNSFNPPYDVYDSRGWYIGSDPDPRVRSMIQRDPSNE